MMSIKEMKARKKELKYTNADISEGTGIPLATVQKIFSGATKHPRYDTILALEKFLSPYDLSAATYVVKEEALDWDAWHEYTEPSKEMWPKQGKYTVKDVAALPEEYRVELIDGHIYDMTSPRVIHQVVLYGLVRAFVLCKEKQDKDCQILFAPIGVKLDKNDKTMVEPDLVILCHENENTEYIEGAPEFVAEVLSPSTRSRDCLLKLGKYAAAGVQEYWIIDPKTEKIITYNFAEGIFPLVYSFHDKIPVAISEGKCEIDFGEIREDLVRQKLIDSEQTEKTK